MAESTKPAKATLPTSVFGVDVPNHELLKLAYDAFLANARQASATTLQRGEVRGLWPTRQRELPQEVV